MSHSIKPASGGNESSRSPAEQAPALPANATVEATAEVAARAVAEASAAAESSERIAKGKQLFLEIKNGNLDAVRRLIAAGADLGLRDENGNTALMLAVTTPMDQVRQVEIVRALLAAGADPNARNAKGQTALMLPQPHPRETIPLLVRAGAELEAKDNEGRTPLLTAASEIGCDDRSRIDALLEAGANPHARDPQGNTAIMLRIEAAAKYNRTPPLGRSSSAEPIEATPEVPTANNRRNPGGTVAVLLDAGTDLNIQNTQGQTALILAAKYGISPGIVTVLLDEGADVELFDKEGNRALDLADANGHTAIAALLRTHPLPDKPDGA